MVRHYFVFIFGLTLSTLALAESTVSEDTTRLEPYKESYFIFSHDGGQDENLERFSDCDVKFQFGVKKQLSPPEQVKDVFAQPLRDFTGTFFFGYVQKSFWDICRNSAPFRESNYNPGVFFENSLGWLNDKMDAQLDNRYGVEHESNGRDGVASRSWDRVFYEQMINFGSEKTEGHFARNTASDQAHFTHEVSVKGWHILSDGRYNERSEHYLGNFELSYAWTGSNYRVKTTARKRSGRLDLFVYDLFCADIFGKADFYWLVQYFNGYGDSLEQHDVRERTLRVGFAFSH